MYLKRLEIYGFKSFGTKSVLDFESGAKRSSISAVVGPNGSGKSNVADAVRWVLGEQSGKLLRSKKNEDVIFCGSSSKSRSSYAEVCIVLASDGPIDVEINNKKFTFNEIEVARKLYRSGESEYLINRKKVRLLDVQQLLATLGFGQSSYTVIGQGMVDRLLFFNAAERKVLFDEAAGVKQYEIKREQAIRKLEGTDANLIRLKDILVELEPRVVNLRRLVKRAEGRKEIEEDLYSIQNKYYLSIETELKKNIDSLRDSKDDLNKKIVQIEKEISSLDIEAEKSQGQDIYNKKLSNLENNISKFTQERDVLIQKVANMEAILFQAQRKLENEKSEKERLARDKFSLEEKAKSLEVKIKTDNNNLANEAVECDSLKKDLAKIELEKSNLNKKVQEVDEAADSIKSKEIEDKINLFDTKRREISSELYSLQQREVFLQKNKSDKEEKINSLNLKLDKSKKERAELEGEKSKAQKLKKETEEEQKKLEVELSALIKNVEKVEKELFELSSQTDQSQVEAFEKEVLTVLDEYKSLEKEIATGDIAKTRPRLSDFFKSVENIFSKVKNLTRALNKTEREKIENTFKKLRDDRKGVENKLNRLAIDLERASLVIERIDERIEQSTQLELELLKELSDLKNSKEEISDKNQLDSLNVELSKTNGQIQELESKLRDMNKSVGEKKQAFFAKINNLHVEEKNLREKMHHLELQLNQKRNILQNQENELENTLNRIKGIERRLEDFSLSETKNDFQTDTELKETKSQLEEKNTKLTDLRKTMSELLNKQRESSQVTLELDRKRRTLESQISELKNKINNLDLEEVKFSTRLEDLVEEIKISEIKLDRNVVTDTLSQAEKDTLRAKMENLRRRLETIGSVDPETVTEYEELDARNKEMIIQVEDLEKAKNDLEKVIKELDQKIKKQFSEVFGSIANEFNRYFQILFEGGKAALTLGEDEEGNFGIEITANPPGKKLQSLSALSGGERTLTSLALVFAILSINPSPFCVLDEVDAALDEANTLRFARILQDLDKKTQFVVISHNRETMKAADSLYGITMDTDHVSKMISVRLTEALETVKA